MYIDQTHLPHSSATLLIFYNCQQPIVYYFSQDNYLVLVETPRIQIDCQHILSPSIHCQAQIQKSHQILEEKGKTYELLYQLEDPKISIRNLNASLDNQKKLSAGTKRSEVKLDYRIEWKNENRNIVPNLLNQALSYLLKPNKSKLLTQRLFNRIPHKPEYTLPKYYQYTRKIKEAISHYVNQSVFLHFLEIHQPNCELYTFQQQLFYMKICRIVLLSFLRNEIKLISLTSKRMSQAKRKIHLIARQALTTKFLQLCRNLKN